MPANNRTKPAKPPTGEGEFSGQLKTTGYNGRAGGGKKYWRWNGSEWILQKPQGWYRPYSQYEDELQAQEAKSAKEAEEEYKRRMNSPMVKVGGKIPAANVTTASAALRYPSYPPITEEHDYVTFSFYKYSPPFAKRTTSEATISSEGAQTITGKDTFTGKLYGYNQATGEGNQYTKTTGQSIVLYMPEDISTGFRSNWTGKAYGNFATNALKTAGGETLKDKLDGAKKTLKDSVKTFIPVKSAEALRKVLQKIGGDQLSNDDIFGGISGAILNPNVELMYGGTDLRNFTLNFKLVARQEEESVVIKRICNQFKRAMLPKLDPGNVFGATSEGSYAGFIGVPDLVRVAFMHGGHEHDALPRFKMCAITQVDVNYTPDGTYATYYDGNPVAVQLSISFQETKMVFSEEIGGVDNPDDPSSQGLR